MNKFVVSREILVKPAMMTFVTADLQPTQMRHEPAPSPNRLLRCATRMRKNLRLFFLASVAVCAVTGGCATWAGAPWV